MTSATASAPSDCSRPAPARRHRGPRDQEAMGTDRAPRARRRHRGKGSRAPGPGAPPVALAPRKVQAHGRLRLELAHRHRPRPWSSARSRSTSSRAHATSFSSPPGPRQDHDRPKHRPPGHPRRPLRPLPLRRPAPARSRRPGIARALERRLHHYAKVGLLVVDEVGFLAFDNRNADLLFQVVSRRYEKKSLVLTTNLAFADWHTIFPSATCATALVERVVHHADVIASRARATACARPRNGLASAPPRPTTAPRQRSGSPIANSPARPPRAASGCSDFRVS